MTGAASKGGADSARRVPLHRNPIIRAIFWQLLIGGSLLLFLGWVYANTVENLEARGIRTSLSFMKEVAPFQITQSFSPFIDYVLGESTFFDVFLVSLLNTLLVSVLSVIGATVLGFVVGVMRLSPNWLVSRIAAVYIETFRNIPLLLQIMFWYFAVYLAALPPPKESWSLGGSIFLNKRGLYLPDIVFEGSFSFVAIVLAVAVGIAATVWMARWARRRQERTGRPFPKFWAGVGLIVGLPVVVIMLAGSSITFDPPVLERFNFVGGIETPLPLFALWFALTTYTAAFIGENVRGGVLSVGHGQTEAARALGLREARILNLVVIPQAMRVIIPPTISQFLNVIKNSSLATAISYPDLVSEFAGISLNQTGQAIVIIGMTMAVYLTFSLITSLILNLYNRRTQLVER